MKNKLKLSGHDRLLSGVCGGIAEYVGISSLGVRIIFLFIPANIIIYLVLAFTMSADDLTY